MARARDQKAQIRHFRAAFVCRICPGSVGPSPHEAERWPDCERHVYGTVCEHTSPDLFHNERGGRARLDRHIGVRFENERPSSAKFILSSTPASISGRAGGALGAREDENQQKAMTGNASCPRGCNPCRTRDSARIARCATAIGERGFPPEPPSQGGSVGSNPIGATNREWRVFLLLRAACRTTPSLWQGGSVGSNPIWATKESRVLDRCLGLAC